MSQKSNEAFRTISEVSSLLRVPAHVLRFWETKFTILRPLKRSGGRRYYRPDDVAVLKRIRDLLYQDGFTIRGAQKLLKNKSMADSVSSKKMPDASFDVESKINRAVNILDEARGRLKSLRQGIKV